MFDLTKEVVLQPQSQKTYAIARAALHFVFLIVMLFVLYRILFPIVPLDFSLDTPDSSRNTLVSPRIGRTGQLPSEKLVKANDILLFNANPIGQFSKANVSFVLEKNADSIENTSVKVRKSYQAFFYPLGAPTGFKNGTLVSTPDGGYYIVSDGKLRKFGSTDIILKLGYPKSAFSEISVDDLKASVAGNDVTDDNNYPNDTLFAIEDSYYQLKNQQLFPFVSVRAFLSQFDGASAIAKGSDFLSRYPVAESSLGFANGTLASSADSVFILSGGKSYPVENAQTFLAMGFSFDDVIAVTTNELGAYEKQRQFTHNDPHPDGILFADQKTNDYFLVEDGQRRPLNNPSVLKTYSEQKPVVADSQGAEMEASCILEKKVLSSNTYECGVSLESLNSLVGNDYQVSASFPADANLSTIKTTFSTPLTFDSLMDSLSLIKTRLKNR